MSYPNNDHYSFKITDDSMTSKQGDSFPKGSTIIAQESNHAKPNAFVIAQVAGSSEATFKQLVIKKGKWLLKSLNSSDPIIDGEFNILGVVVASSISYVGGEK